MTSYDNAAKQESPDRRTHRYGTVIVATILKHALMYLTNINMEEKNIWISKQHLLIEQGKAEVIATKC